METKSKRKVLVFDADDTLWMNDWQYSQAIAGFLYYLYHTLRDKTPNLIYVYNRHFQISNELFKKWGVRRGRVAEGMIRTYREICQWIQWRFGAEIPAKEKERHEKEIRKIGDTPFCYQELLWRPEARAMLKILLSGGNRVCLLTSYDNGVFPDRARFLGLQEFFPAQRVRAIEGRKTKEDFIAVSSWSKEVDADAIWYAVGNGESDILPALEISENWRGVYVPHGTTSKYLAHGEQINNLPPPLCYYMPPKFEHPRVATIYSLSELPKILTEA